MTTVGSERSSQIESLTRAAFLGDLPTVNALLASKIDVNATDQLGRTALQSAACGRSTAMVDLLIRAKANVNGNKERNCTPLMMATLRGYEPIVSQLIVAKADVNAKDGGGRTAMMGPCGQYHRTVKDSDALSTVRALIAAKADVNARDEEGQTAVKEAFRNRHWAITNTLLTSGATWDVDSRLVETLKRYVQSLPQHLPSQTDPDQDPLSVAALAKYLITGSESSKNINQSEDVYQFQNIPLYPPSAVTRRIPPDDITGLQPARTASAEDGVEPQDQAAATPASGGPVDGVGDTILGIDDRIGW